MKTALYRHWRGAELLYVGISSDPYKRTRSHGAQSPWFHKVDRITIEWLPTREDALTREAEAIRSENPRFNRDRKGTTPRFPSASLASPPRRPYGGSRTRARPVTAFQRGEEGAPKSSFYPAAAVKEGLHGWKREGRDPKWWAYIECYEAFLKGDSCPHGVGGEHIYPDEKAAA